MSKILVAKFSLIIVAMSWGATFLPIQKMLKYINVPSFLFFRFLIAGSLLLIFALKFRAKFDKNSIKFGAILGIFMFFDFIFQTYALNYTFSSTVAFIIGLNVVIVPFLLFKTFLNLNSILSAIFAFFGLFLLSGAKGFSIGFGEFLSLISAFAYAFHVIFTGKFAKKTDILPLLISQFFTMSLFCFIYALFFAEPTNGAFNLIGGFEIWLSLNFVYIIIFTSFFATVVAFFVQTKAQIYLNPTQTSLILTLEPVAAGFIGYFIGGENLNLTQILGSVLIIFAILMSELNLIKFIRKFTRKI
ncbi:DMT family transporter [Campylobacter sp. FMV-PI01]|uniref:DMT family transporter n=1 Tax=Campylobacter portucalensis TaxID=2608384 RepID=A0A6L5WGF6_9BACT|nr:DMT family transporter [Campylobacter portucalensis]MSN96258.1 DMT family transporter [Campylobacter portucalensis]